MNRDAQGTITSEHQRPLVRDGVSRGSWLALTVVAGGLFLAVVSTTVVSVALPSIGADLGATATDLEWIVDSYVLVYAALLVTGGVIGDRYGRKGVFMIGAVLFGLGSLITGLAPTMGVLLFGRVIQGLGPAFVVPGSLTIIRATFDDEARRAVAIGLWSTSSGLALAVGPGLGGLLVEGGGWRWVFLINVPLAAVLVGMAGWLIPRLPRTPARHRFDWAGAFLTVAGLGMLVFAVIEGQARGWTSPVVLASVLGGVAALGLFVAVERRQAEPLINVSLFLRPAFTVANAAALVVFFAFVGVIVYFSVYFQQVRGHSPLMAGLDVSAIGVALAISAAWTGRLVGRVGERWPMIVGLLLGGVATLGLLRLDADTGVGSVVGTFALLGTGIGLCGTVSTTIAMSSVDALHAGMASAIVNALRQVGQVFGVAVLGALVYANVPDGGGHRLAPADRPLFVAGLHDALWVSGVALLAVALLAAVVLPREPPRRSTH